MTRIPNQDDYDALARRTTELEEQVNSLSRYSPGVAAILQRLSTAEESLSDLESRVSVLETAEVANLSIHDWFDDRISTLEDNFNLGTTIPLDSYVESPQKFSEQDVHGGLTLLDTAHVLQTGAPLAVTKGIGKLYFVTDSLTVPGQIEISGTSVNRNTGVETASDTEILTINTLSTDSSGTDAQGNPTWDIADGVLSSKWWTGSVTIAEASLGSFKGTIDTYHVSFEQLNDAVVGEIQTFDVNVLTTDATAWGYWYLYIMQKNVFGRFDIVPVTDISIPSGSALTNEFWRLRRGLLSRSLNPMTDGLFVNIFLGPINKTYFQDMSMKIWSRALGSDIGLLSPDPNPVTGGGRRGGKLDFEEIPPA